MSTGGQQTHDGAAEHQEAVVIECEQDAHLAEQRRPGYRAWGAEGHGTLAALEQVHGGREGQHSCGGQLRQCHGWDSLENSVVWLGPLPHVPVPNSEALTSEG